MKYELTRCRFRKGITEEDVGPEWGWFRYEITIGVFTSIDDCFNLISKFTGFDIEEVKEKIKYSGFIQSKYIPTGYKHTDDYGRKRPEWYFDEYAIVKRS